MRGFGRKKYSEVQSLDEKVYLQLTYVAHILHRLRCNPEHAGKDIARGQGKVMVTLSEHPDISQKELLELIGMRQQSLGEMLDKLEKSGYLTKEKSSTDRRKSVLRLTKEGETLALEMKEAHEHFQMPEFLEDLTEEEKMAFLHSLDKMARRLDERYSGQICRLEANRDKEEKKWKHKM